MLVTADTQEGCGDTFDFVRTTGVEAGQLVFVVGRESGEQAA